MGCRSGEAGGPGGIKKYSQSNTPTQSTDGKEQQATNGPLTDDHGPGLCRAVY